MNAPPVRIPTNLCMHSVLALLCTLFSGLSFAPIYGPILIYHLLDPVAKPYGWNANSPHPSAFSSAPSATPRRACPPARLHRPAAESISRKAKKEEDFSQMRYLCDNTLLFY